MGNDIITDAMLAEANRRLSASISELGSKARAVVDRCEALEAALKEAWWFIAQEREIVINSCAIGGDPETLDEAAAEVLKEIDRLLAQIDAALAVRP